LNPQEYAHEQSKALSPSSNNY